MNRTLIAFTVHATLLFATSLVHDQGQGVNKPKEPRIGEIKIAGNDVTRDDVIRNAIGLYPGSTFCAADLRAAEKNLIELGFFQVNPKTGTRPTVQVIDPDSEKEFKDILVSIEEKPSTASFKPMVALSPTVGMGIALVYEERNFDCTRIPTSFDDLCSGRSFRGAGQTFHAGLLWSIGPPRLFISLK